MTKKSDESLVAATAATLASQTASKAAELANVAAQTAANLAAETAKSTAVMSNDLAWVKKSLEGIEIKLETMSGVFVNHTEFTQLLKDGDDREKRIRSLEENMWKYLGGVSVITMIITIGTGFALKMIK